MLTDEAVIRREFEAGELDFISAIECLEGLGYDPKEAEIIVTEWLEDKS